MIQSASAATALDSLVGDLNRLLSVYTVRGTFQAKGYESAASPLMRDLLLCSALLRNVIGRKENQSKYRHVVVFGGTQVGKSAVVNILAGFEVARVHHTAGFTRHAQGFYHGDDAPTVVMKSFPAAFPWGRRVDGEMLDHKSYENYLLESLDRPFLLSSDKEESLVLWDAPDCDAVESAEYLLGVIEVLTLADLVIYVTTREKYAIRHILEWVYKIGSGGIPYISCLNMTPAPQQADILEDMVRASEKIPDLFHKNKTVPKASVALGYIYDGDISRFYDEENFEGTGLRKQVQKTLNDVKNQLDRRRIDAIDFVADVFPELLKPARLELDAAKNWEGEVEAGISRFIEDYKTGYLNDPHRFDAFNRVGFEILALLNPPIPGLDKALVAVRTVLSLPAKAIIWGGRTLWKKFVGTSQGNGPQKSFETVTYEEANERFVNGLKKYINNNRKENPHVEFWQNLDLQWEETVPVLMPLFEQELQIHKGRVQEWSRETAQAIYKELEREPVKLNLLRTGRVAADAGAIIVSLKTGGAGDIVHDIVVAPALMSIVEAVSQQLTGNYVESKKQELKQRLVTDTRGMLEKIHGTKLNTLGRDALLRLGINDDDRIMLDGIPDKIAEIKARVNAGEFSRNG